jgi:hypothetical protein
MVARAGDLRKLGIAAVVRHIGHRRPQDVLNPCGQRCERLSLLLAVGVPVHGAHAADDVPESAFRMVGVPLRSCTERCAVVTAGARIFAGPDVFE